MTESDSGPEPAERAAGAGVAAGGANELGQYDYELPAELIAQHPLARRADARLMIVDRRLNQIDHAHVRDLPSLLDPADALVLNDTRVVPARLVGRRARTGGRWEGLFLEADDRGHWQVLSKTRGRPEPGETVVLHDPHGCEALELILLAPLGGGQWAVRPVTAEPAPPLEILERLGRVPLPHYIRQGEMVATDRAAYQTVYARHPGAVAAPTAGLHFTRSLLEAVERSGVAVCHVTLHVGLGTFRPIQAQRLDEHPMHREWGRLTGEVAERLRQRRRHGGRIVAVGTTSVRVLESASADGQLQAWEGETELFIRPPYAFHSVDTLLTNFHLPRSTLLVLVRTFGGDPLLRRAYQEAVDQRYRFYSYGDAMLIR